MIASEVVFPVCSANYARQHNLTGTLTSADLTRISLLHQDIRDTRWLDWLQWCRLAELVMAPRKDLYRYNNYALLLNAALAHQGVALGWSILVQDYLDSGQLVALGPRVARQDYGYWLSLKHHRSAVVEPISDWLLEAVPPSP